MKDNKYIIGITQGEATGIGPEILLKLVSIPQLGEKITFVVFASPKVLTFYKKHLNLPTPIFHFASEPELIKSDAVNLVNLGETPDFIPGKPTQETGKLARKAVLLAGKWLKNKKLDILITLPIDKHNVFDTREFPYKGHTKYFTELFQAEDALMFMVSDELKVALTTEHVPIKELSQSLSREKIYRKLKLLNKSLQEDFGIVKPRIAALGLNPHAGDNGTLGNEEDEIIFPALHQAEKDGIFVLGCYPADGYFAAGTFSRFDATLAMYHDQGLIPFKYISENAGVNFTAGLPEIRLAPAHGTAYDIAGKGKASIASTLNAVYTGIQIFRNRKIREELPEPLPKFNSNQFRAFLKRH